ncbi:DMT family transporter [Fictibacillus iocasae]|uniref:DMT family transporter n=1 Tax=Fictibacillus iocasae TaxID=2715437 RepID=A0ABW2NTP5_9BACL
MTIRRAYAAIISSAILWGTIGWYVHYLREAGFTSLQIVWLRAAAAALFFFLYAIIQFKAVLRIQIRDMKYFFATGILSITFFNWCYFTAIHETSVAVAAVLLYTAPVFVILLSRIVFKSPITKRTLAALLVTAAGCLFVSGVMESSSSVTIFGIFTGLGAGLGYALYSIFGKAASVHHSPLTISFYTFLVAAAGLLPFVQANDMVPLLLNIKTWFVIAGLGLFPTVLAYYLYTSGLKHADPGAASILSTVEPAVAAMMGIFLFKEQLSWLQYSGIVFILIAVILLSDRKKKHSIDAAA